MNLRRSAAIRALSLLLCLLLGLSLSAPVHATSAAEYKAILTDTLAHIHETVDDPCAGSTGGEWAVLALARGGVEDKAWYDRYLANLYPVIDECGGVLHSKKYTEYSRTIIGLSCIGQDATRVDTGAAVYDLVAPLMNRQSNGKYWATWQGNNGTVFAIIAMDTRNYYDNAAGRRARADLIDALLDAQGTDYGWSITSGDATSIDVTAMAIQALAPYYLSQTKYDALGAAHSYSALKTAVNGALSCLKNARDGGYGANYGSVEAAAQVVVALAALDRDAANDALLGDALGSVLAYYAGNGAFSHDSGGGSGANNQMSTEQAAYALVAYDRWKNGKNSLYDMTDALPPADPLALVSVKASKTTAAVGDSVTWTATASGGTGALRYCFYVYKDGAIVKKGSYGAANSISYAVTEAGTYSVKGFVKDAAGKSVSRTGDSVTVSAGALTLSSVKASKTTAAVGDTVTWTATASGGTGALRYCFYVYKDGAIVFKSGYKASSVFSYTPEESGTYSVKGFVKDAAGKSVSRMGDSVTVSAGALTISSVKANKTTANVGDTVTWTATASGGTGALRYCFYVYKDGAIVFKSGYKASSVFSYTPEESGTYSVKGFVKDAAGKSVSRMGDSVTVSAGPLTISSVKANKTTANVGDTVTWTATASGGTGALRYCFYVYKDGATVFKSGYKASSVFSYTLTETGTYTVKGFVKDAAGKSVSRMGDSVGVG